MQRLRLWDVKMSRLPGLVGFCQSDTPRIADMVNTCQRRLLYAKEAGDEGWWGTWAEIAFTVSRDNPYITLPREVARLAAVDICQRPRPIQNQWYEYLRFGNGRMPKQFRCQFWPGLSQIYSRNAVPTFTDLTNAPQLLRVYLTSVDDLGKKVLLQGTDNNGQTITSIFGANSIPVQGEYVFLTSPFVASVNQFSTITGIQKDQTVGSIQIFQVDPTSGAQVLLLTMEPSETTAWYRRYLFNPLPINCCPGLSTNTRNVQVTAIAKLDLIPAQVDQDYLLIQNLEALTEEAQSVRLSEVDNKNSKAMAAERHQQAIRLLNGEITHYLGLDEPAVQFAPFGSAKLWHQRIGTNF